MALTITHPFVSSKPQASDPTIISGPQWNQTHVVSGTLDSTQSTFTQLGTGAVQRSVSSKLQDVVSVMDFGAVGDGSTDDTTAIQNALNSGFSVYVPQQPGPYYKITSPLSMLNHNGQIFYGSNCENTIICQFTDNTPVLRVGGTGALGGFGQVVSGLMFRGLNEQSSSNTSSIGIELNNLSQSLIQDVVVYSTATSIGINQSVNPNAAFSNFFNKIRLDDFSIRALDLRSVNTISTGSVIQEIYCNNVRNDTSRGSCTTAIELGQHSSTFLANINVEDCVCTKDAVLYNQVLSGQLVAMHFERVTLNAGNQSFLNIANDLSQLVVTGLDVVFCTIGTGIGPVGILQFFGNPNCKFTGITSGLPGSNNTITGGAYYLVWSLSGTTGSFDITQSQFPDVSGEQNVPAANPPVVKRVNLDWRHRTEGGKNILWGTAAPVSGTWSVGDKVYQTAPVSGGFEGFICTTAGTPGTWKTFGPIS